MPADDLTIEGDCRRRPPGGDVEHGGAVGRVGIVVLLHPHALLLLPLGAPVLEPDLHLRFVELQAGGHLHPPGPRQILVEVELLLQLGQLLGGEVGPDHVVLARDTEFAHNRCWEEGERGKNGWNGRRETFGGE